MFCYDWRSFRSYRVQVGDFSHIQNYFQSQECSAIDTSRAKGLIRTLRNIYMTVCATNRTSQLYLPLPIIRRSSRARASVWNKERRILAMHRRVERVWVSRGGHLSSEVCADSITGEKTERTREWTSERPALSKDKGGNSPRQIIEWPDSASLFLFPSLSLVSFLSCFYPSSFVPTESTWSTGFSHVFGKAEIY